MSENLKQALLKETRLLSISQSDCDLFFIGQANAITYEQLAEASTAPLKPAGALV